MQLHKNKAIKAQFLHRRLAVSGSLQETVCLFCFMLSGRFGVRSLPYWIQTTLELHPSGTRPKQLRSDSLRKVVSICPLIRAHAAPDSSVILGLIDKSWQTPVRASISSSMLDILSHESWSMHEKISAITIDEKRLDEGKSERKLLSRAADWFLYPVYRSSLCRRTKGQNISILYDRMLL